MLILNMIFYKLLDSLSHVHNLKYLERMPSSKLHMLEALEELLFIS